MHLFINKINFSIDKIKCIGNWMNERRVVDSNTIQYNSTYKTKLGTTVNNFCVGNCSSSSSSNNNNNNL